MKWKNCQLLIFTCYFLGFTCFCSGLFFPSLVKSLEDNSRHMAKSIILQADARRDFAPKPKKKKIKPEIIITESMQSFNEI